MKNVILRLSSLVIIIFKITALFSQQLIHSTVSGGNWDNPSTWAEGVVPGMNDTVIIAGPVTLLLNHSCYDICIAPGGSLAGITGNRYITAFGNLSNEGIISNGGSLLFMTIHGNIRNAGAWQTWSVNLAGSGIQQIDCEGDSYFQCNQFQSTKPSGHLASQHGLNFRETNVMLDNRELYLPRSSGISIRGNYLRNVVIRGDSSILYMTNGAYLQDVTADRMILQGVVMTGNNAVSFTGYLVVEDTLQNFGSTHFTSITGDLTNNGCILNGSSYLNLYIHGNITHNGVWNNYSTTITGSGIREIQMAEQCFIRSYMLITDGPQKIVAHSDLRFLNTRINFNYDTLCLPEKGMFYINFTEGGNRYLRNIVITGNDGYLETRNGTYLENTALHDIHLRGVVQTGNNYNFFFGNVTVLDTLQNYGSSAHNCFIEGNIVNNGVIRDETGLLNLFVSGNITNNFIWTNYTTTLTGYAPQHIHFAPGVVFAGAELLVTGTKQISAGSSLSFANTRIDFNGNTLVLGHMAGLQLSGGTAFLREITLSGNKGNLSLRGGAYIQDAIVENMGLEGRIKIYGNNILLRGAVINYDTIENTGIDHTLVIEGNITNYGAIIDGENHLITDIQGNAVNEGGWDNHEIRLSGSTDKQLLFRNDSLVGAPVRLASGLYGSPFQWYKNDVPVPGAGSPDLYLSGVGPGDFGVYHCTSQYGISANFTINRAVAAQFAVSDTAGCLPLTVQFTEMSASPGQINNRLWDFGDGESSAEENPVHTYTTKGIYGVSLTVCDASGCDSVRVENLIDVGFTPLADFTFENEISGNPVHFTDRSLGADSVILSFTDWADTVLAFSSRYTPPPPYPEWWWSEEQVLGEPDVYPLYGDYHEAWAPLTACGQREFIVVGFDEPRRINRVMIYETLHPGAIDTVYVLPDSGGMVAVWEGTAEPLALAAREFIVDFELTSFGVAGVRIAMNTEAVPYWNEIDAVAVSGPADTVFSPEIHYLWETGENGITYATSGDIAHTYGSAGRFDASLTVDYKNICFSTKEKTVTVYETGTLGLDFRAFLEGPFESGSMASGLSDALPLSHPYSAAPWHHQGDEEVSGMPSQEIVDWILVELRKSSGPPCSAVPDSTVCKSACFIDQEGRLRGSDGLTPPRVFLTEENNLYAVIYHRNHLPVMSAVHIQKTGNDFIFDFTADPLNIFGGENACKQVAPGTWALAGADGNADGQVNNGDKNDVWIPSAGLQGYHAADYNLDGQVNNGDKNDVWIPNTGLGGQVPE